jgi:hypothetical protein
MVNLTLCTSNSDFEEVLHETLQYLHLFEEPDAHVGCYLVVPGSASV